MADGYVSSKKYDDSCCEHYCAQGTEAALSISRLRCMLRGIDFKTYILFFLVIPTCAFGIYLHGQKISYFLRPLWESPPKPFHDISHYYHENVSMVNLCKLHRWGIRESPRRVFDAVLFSNEVDMLTIRWNELYPYITRFVLLESNSTFTGLPKPMIFASNRDKFKFVESMLTYGTIGGQSTKGQNPFIEEAYQRVALDQLLRIAGIEDDDLLIMSDVDEIPSSHTINLLRWCDETPPILHLRLKNYLYSFEFFQDNKSWRASIHRYVTGKTRYAHYRQSDELLSDAGWHCSFCFRHINDFIFKMKAYSHYDRVRFPHFLKPKRIQDTICKGANLFDMIPEEYTFKEIIGKLGNIPHSYSGVYLPAFLLNNAEKYKYLLSGNCKRKVVDFFYKKKKKKYVSPVKFIDTIYHHLGTLFIRDVEIKLMGFWGFLAKLYIFQYFLVYSFGFVGKLEMWVAAMELCLMVRMRCIYLLTVYSTTSVVN